MPLSPAVALLNLLGLPVLSLPVLVPVILLPGFILVALGLPLPVFEGQLALNQFVAFGGVRLLLHAATGPGRRGITSAREVETAPSRGMLPRQEPALEVRVRLGVAGLTLGRTQGAQLVAPAWFRRFDC